MHAEIRVIRKFFNLYINKNRKLLKKKLRFKLFIGRFHFNSRRKLIRTSLSKPCLSCSKEIRKLSKQYSIKVFWTNNDNKITESIDGNQLNIGKPSSSFKKKIRYFKNNHNRPSL